MWENKCWVKIGREETITVPACCQSAVSINPKYRSCSSWAHRGLKQKHSRGIWCQGKATALKLSLMAPMVWLSVLRRAAIINGLVWMGFRELEIPGRAILQAEKLSLQHTIRPDCISRSVPRGAADTQLLYPLWCFVGTQTTWSIRSALPLLYFRASHHSFPLQLLRSLNWFTFSCLALHLVTSKLRSLGAT